MDDTFVIVDGYVATDLDSTDLREEAWSFALSQRDFGPRRLVVALADASGRLIGMAHTQRTDPPELALGPCIAHIGRGATVAIAYCDEPVTDGPPPRTLTERFAVAQEIAASHGVHLVDWFACDDQLLRSSRLALFPDEPWWDVP